MKTNIIKIFLFVVLSLNLYATDEQEIQELRDQVKVILMRIDALEKRAQLESATKVDKVIVKDESAEKTEALKPKLAQNIVDDASGKKPPVQQKGILELKTAETVLSVGGRIQLDTHYSWPTSSHGACAIPIGSSPGENGHITFDSKYSRIWVKTRTPSEYGPIRTLIETDFIGSEGNEKNTNASHLRIRHAYAQVGNWTVGQTNSSFNTFATLDILYTAINDVFARQPLIRYSQEGKEFSYDISLEQPETTLLDPDGVIITPKDDVIPDIVARLRYYPSWGELGISLMGRYINQDRAELSDGTELNNRDSAFGWATNVSGKVKVLGSDDIRFAVHYGVGLGRYISYNAYAAGSIDENGNIKLQPTYGGHIGYRHWWNDKLRSTISVSYVATKNNMKVINSDASRSAANKDAYSSQVNLLWTPVPNALIGVEYVKAGRTVESNEKGDLDTAMLRFIYDF